MRAAGPEVIARLPAAVARRRRRGSSTLSSDPDHNRSVLTLAGEPEALHHGLLALYQAALAEIDLTGHTGSPPAGGRRPRHPLRPPGRHPDVEAVAAAERLGAEVARRFGLPVYLYEQAGATAGADPARRHPPRRLRGLRRQDRVIPPWAPDFGPSKVHPTAGVTVIGARFFLIAFNAVLDSPDIVAARAIARRVRESGGGLPAVRAMGVWLASRGRAQVSMNLVDYRRTPILQALRRVEEEAAELGARVMETELIGLVPAEAVQWGDGGGAEEAGARADARFWLSGWAAPTSRNPAISF